MHPTVVDLSAHRIFMVVAVLVAVVVPWPEARRRGVSLVRLASLQAALAVVAVIGAGLLAQLEWSHGLAAWQTVGNVGPRYPGALIAIAVTLPPMRRVLIPNVSLGSCFDLIAPGIAFGTAVFRIGCLLQGCCFGVQSTLPWAISFPPFSPAAQAHWANGLIPEGAASLPVHPLQIYFGLASLAVGMLLLKLRHRLTRAGDLFLVFLILHEGSKAALEVLRSSPAAHPTTHLQVLSLACAILAGTVFLARRGGARTLPA